MGVSRLLAGAVLGAAVLAAAACAPDPAVSSLAPTPVTTVPQPTTTTTVSATSPPTTPTTTPATTEAPPSTERGPLETLPSNPTVPVTVVVDPGLPPIVAPELFTEVPIDEVVDIGEHKTERSHDALVGTALRDLDEWLAAELPGAFGVEWHPLEGGIWAGYPDRESDLPGCGEPITRYRDLTEYAAFYCEAGDFMVYDDGEQGLIVGLADDLGPVVLGVVFAHEFGHAVQARADILVRGVPTVITEQQADCIAGAWTRRVYLGESPNLRVGDRDLRSGLVAMLEVRDPAGIDQFDIGGHGTAFDRIGAFQHGFVNELAGCAGLVDEPLPLMPNTFRTRDDQLAGGNAPYDCVGFGEGCTPAPEFLADDLNDYWDDVQPGFEPLTPVAVGDFATFSCPDEIPIADEVSYCPGGEAVAFDEPAVLDLYETYGDFTLGYFYGIAWAEVAQIRSGSTLTGEARALRNDCWTGAWVADITPDADGRTRRSQDLDGDGEPDSTVLSSPGDLDEAVRMAIIIGDLGPNVDRIGSPFEKIERFRAGVLGGMDACG